MIPINELNEHLKIELMDPKHREIKKVLEERTKSHTMASGDEINENL